MTAQPPTSPTPAVAVARPVAVALPSFSLTQVLPWLMFAGLLVLAGLYFVSTEQGALSMLSGTAVHEWTHDGRHLLGFPCH